MRLVLAVIAMFAAWPTFARTMADIPPAGEARITLLGDQGTYEVRVYRAAVRAPPSSTARHFPTGKGYAGNWKVAIRCIDKCTCPDTLIEDLGWDSPDVSGLMGVWQVLDGSPAVVTSWQRGTGYGVRIFGCRAGHMEKWLEVWSRGVSTVTVGTGDMPVVSAPDADGSSPVVWTWNGQRYVSSGDHQHR